MIWGNILFITFWNQLELFLSQSNGFKDFCLAQIILLNINYLLAHNVVVTVISILHKSYNSIWFNCAELNGSKYCYESLTIQLDISNLFINS